MIPTPPYATPEQLTSWLEGGEYDPPESPERILQRASEVVDDWTFGTYERDSLSGLPIDADLLGPLMSATCAQVEAWLEVGEENDIATYEPGVVLAPRARRILSRAGLLTDGAANSAPIGVTLV